MFFEILFKIRKPLRLKIKILNGKICERMNLGLNMFRSVIFMYFKGVVFHTVICGFENEIIISVGIRTGQTPAKTDDTKEKGKR